MHSWKSELTLSERYPIHTQEISCHTMADCDEERYIREVIPWFSKDVFGRVFLTFPGSSALEVLHPFEFFRLKAACSHVGYYLLGQVDNNNASDSIVTKEESIMNIYS